MRTSLVRNYLIVLFTACLSTFSLGQTGSNTLWMASKDEAPRIARFENGIAKFDIQGQAPIEMSLQKWMEILNIPGLSVAVFDHGKIVWAKGYGVKESSKNTPVTLDTLFQAGSISKPVTVLAALHFVEAGKFTLDENINDKLISWKVPDNEFTKDQKVTLRRIMSHSAGTTVHGFPGYALGEKVPTLVQVLNGERPANTDSIRVDMVPGTKFRYSGGGTTIMQLMLVDQLKKPFPEIMRETVIGPLGLKNSTYEQPMPPERAANAASGHRASGKVLDGKWHVYPELAAAGLWTTASDLARVALEVCASKKGESNHVISQAMTKQMLTVQAEPVGLGFFLRSGTDEFGHDGSDEGFQADLIGFSDSCSGIAIMANSDNGAMIFERIAESTAKEYNWTSFHKDPDSTFMKVAVTATVRGVPAGLALYESLKADGPAKEFTPGVLNGIGYRLLSAGDVEGATKVFEKNVLLYSDDSNAFDSLAEAYMNAGRKDEAIANYRKSLKMNPKNDNAVKRLKKMGVDWVPEK